MSMRVFSSVYELEALNTRFALVLFATDQALHALSAPTICRSPMFSEASTTVQPPQPPPRRPPGTSQPGELRENLRYRSVETGRPRTQTTVPPSLLTHEAWGAADGDGALALDAHRPRTSAAAM